MPWTAEAFLATNPWTDATYLSERQHLANSELTATQLADFLSYYQRQAIKTAARLATTTTTYIHPLLLSFPPRPTKATISINILIAPSWRPTNAFGNAPRGHPP